MPAGDAPGTWLSEENLQEAIGMEGPVAGPTPLLQVAAILLQLQPVGQAPVLTDTLNFSREARIFMKKLSNF